MSKFADVSERFAALPYMKQGQAEILRDLIDEQGAVDVLEIGFFHGKSSAYIAAALEDRGAGHLTTIDNLSAAQREPRIEQLLDGLQLSHRVTPIFAQRSYTWALQQLISTSPRPLFDLCYFDGGHVWDSTGFGVVLVDILLRPGGLIILDDMDWSVATSAYHRENPKAGAMFSADERAAQPVRLTWELLLPHLGYAHVREIKEAGWGVARKGDRAINRGEAVSA